MSEVADTIITRHRLPLRQYHLWTGCRQIPNGVHTHIETKKERCPYICRRREDRANKVRLESIREVLAQGQCQRRCLENIHDLDILGLRYKIWDSRSYSQRGTWIRGILEAAKVCYRVEGRKRVKFHFKIGDLAVCNKCYGVAVGYSKRQFKRLKGAV